MSAVFERALSAGMPQAPRDLWPRMLRLWLDGRSTLEIAQTLKIRECSVYNALPKARREAA